MALQKETTNFYLGDIFLIIDLKDNLSNDTGYSLSYHPKSDKYIARVAFPLR